MFLKSISTLPSRIITSGITSHIPQLPPHSRSRPNEMSREVHKRTNRLWEWTCTRENNIWPVCGRNTASGKEAEDTAAQGAGGTAQAQAEWTFDYGKEPGYRGLDAKDGHAVIFPVSSPRYIQGYGSAVCSRDRIPQRTDRVFRNSGTRPEPGRDAARFDRAA